MAAAAAAAVMICASVAVWAPSRGHNDGRPGSSAVVDGAKSHEDIKAARDEPKALKDQDRNVPQRTFARPRRIGSQPASGVRSGTQLLSAALKTSNRSALPGSRSVSLKQDSDGEPLLEIATTNPNVLILWYVDEGSKKDDDDE